MNNSLVLGAQPKGLDPRLLRGLLVGLVAASIGALYTVIARWGLARGLESSDLTFLRFATAGVVTLPLIAQTMGRDHRGFTARWRAWMGVALLAGPLFGLLMFTALQWAPASHAAVFPFTAMSVMGTLMSTWFLGDRFTLRKCLGIGIVITGLIILSGLDPHSLQGRALLGDAIFIVAGSLWAGFGIVMRKNALEPLVATSFISLVALVTYVPVYLWAVGMERVLAAAPAVVWIEVLVQGLIAGVGTLYTYSKMVSILGAARAAVFPALAPGLAALIAWPVLNQVPSGMETVGLLISMVGLVVTVTRGISPKPSPISL